MGKQERIVGDILWRRKGALVVFVAAIALFLTCMTVTPDQGRELGPESLLEAVKRGDHRTVRNLLRKGVDPNLPETEPPLVWAVRRGDLRMVRCLLRAGARTDLTSETWGRIPVLHNAAYKGLKEVAEALLAHGADLNQRSSRGFSVLHAALKGGDGATIRFLVEKGAHLAPEGCDLPDAAARGEWDRMTALLGTVPAADCAGEMGLTALHCAAAVGDLQMIDVLVNKGAKIDVQSKDGLTPLHFAATAGNVEVIDKLVSAGVDLDVRDQDGLPPLAVAVSRGRAEAASALLDAGATVSGVRRSSGSTLLHMAVSHPGNQSIVERLLDAGLDPDARGFGGRTALHQTAASGLVGIAQVLLDRGAKMLPDDYGMTPTMVAVLSNPRPMAILDVLRRAGADLSARDNDGRTALHYTAITGKGEVAEWLLENGADPQAVDTKGRTPADMAEEVGYRKVARLLRPHAR